MKRGRVEVGAKRGQGWAIRQIGKSKYVYAEIEIDTPKKGVELSTTRKKSIWFWEGGGVQLAWFQYGGSKLTWFMW